MILSNEAQKAKVVEIWDYYIANNKRFINASKEYTQEELDAKRIKVIEEAKGYIDNYINDHISLEEFKSAIDGLNKRNRLWGFRGINGQMFFNMLYNSSSSYGLLDNFNTILKQVIPAPAGILDAKQKIRLLADFSESLGKYAIDKRQAPRTGSTNFFISYFWQIQDHLVWPIYYKSMTEVLMDTGLWSPSGDLPKDYEEFYTVNLEMKEIIEEKNKKTCTLWDIEHALWLWGQRSDVTEEKAQEEIKGTQHSFSELPSSFIPPVVSILPLLAANDPQIAELCQKTGISVDKAFEERIGTVFKMMGYQVQVLGQGAGRVPDGIAVCSEHHYAIIYDAKVRSSGYSLGTDDRAIKEYILHETERLKRQGIKNVYFLVISSSFNEDYEDKIRALKIETEIREIIFMEAAALLTLLEQKLRNPDFDLGPRGMQNILAQSGTVTNADVKELFSS